MIFPSSLGGCWVEVIGATSSVNVSGKGGCSVVEDEGVVVRALGDGEWTVEHGGSSRKVIDEGNTGDCRSDGDNSSISKSSSKVGMGESSSRFDRSNNGSKC